MTLKTVTLAALAALAVPALAEAAFVVDTGTPAAPTPNAMPLTLDGNDFYAAEFNLAADSTINSIAAYVTAGMDAPGDTFTMALYSSADFGSRFASPVFATQATYTADGWTTVGNLGLSESAGTYWVALEVGSTDSAIGLSLPQAASAGGTAPALAFAYNSGSGYTTNGALPFGVQVDASAVPLPSAAWLLGGGLLFGAGSMARQRRRRLVQPV